LNARGAPLVVLIHGWLGDSTSSYLLTTAARLFDAGYAVARLQLRDHGASEHLNEEMFHSARIDEVVDACDWLARVYGEGGMGLVGYSLGGNFALRVTGHVHRLPALRATVAICPVIEPGPTMRAIDDGWFGYRHYFVRKWHRAMAAKQRAFPKRFELESAFALDRVTSLTDYFVAHHTPFASSHDYFAAYAIDAARVSAITTPTWILAAADDPVIPASTFDGLPHNPALTIELAAHGGHCAFLSSYTLQSGVDDYVVDILGQRLSPPPPSH
jgi:predicted alpha/beta-fold hydrolase